MNVIKVATDQPLNDQKAAGGLRWAEDLGRAVARDPRYRERDRNQKRRREEVKEAHSQMEPFYF